MGQGASLRLILASLVATAMLAFGLGAATTLWLLSPHRQAGLATAPTGTSPGVAVPALVAPAGAALPPESDQPPVPTPSSAAPAASAAEASGAAAPRMAQPVTGKGATSAAPAAARPAAAAAPTAGAPAAAPAAPPPVPPRALADHRGQTYQVHLGAFPDAATAARLAAMLQERGFPIGVVESPLADGATVHLARSAEFGRREDALRLAARLHRDLGIDPLVVRAAPAPPAAGGNSG